MEALPQIIDPKKRVPDSRDQSKWIKTGTGLPGVTVEKADA